MPYRWRWDVFFERVPFGDATYLDWMIAGLKTTVGLSIAAWIVALAVGSIMGVLRTVPSRLLSGIAAVYVEVFRNIPLLVQLFIWYFVIPELVPPRPRQLVQAAQPAAAAVPLGDAVPGVLHGRAHLRAGARRDRVAVARAEGRRRWRSG